LDLKVTKLNLIRSHKPSQLNSINASENLTNIVTIECRCRRLNNCMLCYLWRWWRVLGTV